MLAVTSDNRVTNQVAGSLPTGFSVGSILCTGESISGSFDALIKLGFRHPSPSLLPPVPETSRAEIMGCLFLGSQESTPSTLRQKSRWKQGHSINEGLCLTAFFFQAEDGIRDYKVTGVQTCVFFFQAEDGIRDYKVTGVQTCALPI